MQVSIYRLRRALGHLLGKSVRNRVGIGYYLELNGSS